MIIPMKPVGSDLMSLEFKTIIVRQPWAGLITRGYKSLGVRTINTKIRGVIGIYASKYRYTKRETGVLISHFKNLKRCGLITNECFNCALDLIQNGERGKIIGTAILTESFPDPLKDFNYFISIQDQHLAPDSYYSEKGNYFWVLKNPVNFMFPINFTPAKGTMMWFDFEVGQD